MQLIYGIMNHVRGCWILSTTQYPLGLSRLFFFSFFFIISTAFLLLFFYLVLCYGPSAWTINILSPHNCHSFLFLFLFFMSTAFLLSFSILSSLIVWPIGLDNKYIKSTQLSFIFFKIFYTHNMNAIMFVSLHKRYSNSNN